MLDSILYDENCLFCSSEFHTEAMGFFLAVGHASTTIPLIVAKNIFHCIYMELKFNTRFEKVERAAFSSIESLSHLFTLDSNAFYKNCGFQIHYYAISISTNRGNRTVVANTIINAFAKNTIDYIVILFRHEKMCMLSFTKKANSSLLYFSDWFDEADVFEMISRIDIANLSLQNSNEFFLDFVYMAARKYYIETISREYAISEWYFMNPFSDDDDCRPKWNEYCARVLNAHIFQYGDDYIELSVIVDYQTNDFDGNDFDFDLLELELDEMMAMDTFEMDEDSYDNDDDNDYSDDAEHINAENVPPNIMSDPVKLLEWLNQN